MNQVAGKVIEMVEKFVDGEDDESVKFEPSLNIVSVNGRDKLPELQKQYPKMEIVVGKLEADDKPVSLDLAQMEYDRINQINAATESTLGKRIDRLDHGTPFPFPGVMFIIGLLTGVAATFGIFNL